MFPKRSLLAFLALLTVLFRPQTSISQEVKADTPPTSPREFRAVWVATVGNIDWPSRPGLSNDAQKREAIAILNRAAELNLNAIIFQVRTSADALYDSKLEPWSAFLTGTQGQAPEPFYDPLRFWIDEAHQRGLQLHAWFNPFRARYSGAKGEESARHISKTHPELVKTYGNQLWLDPGEPEAQEHSYNVFMDVVRRYDIDGVHIDDYFYPYPIPDPENKGRELDFPDEPSWTRYRESGGSLDKRADWRRQNINSLIARIYHGIKAEKPHVQFGISPFGIARPGRPAVVKGFDQYEKLYADAERWLAEGWCDYWTPQLYWTIDAPAQPYRALLEFWVARNAKGRHVWPGNFTSRVGLRGRDWEPEEILNQIAVTRETPGATGNVHFSMKVFLEDRKQIVERLKDGPYRVPALVPPSPWLDDKAPARPSLTLKTDGDTTLVTLEPAEGEPPFLWSVFVRRGDEWQFSVHPGASRRLTFPADDGPINGISAAAVDRLGNESPRVSATPAR